MKLTVKGNVFYAPGSWGVALGATSVQVEIIETHTGGTPEVLATFTTGTDGAFQGDTKDWQRPLKKWVIDFPGSLFPPRPPRGHWEDTNNPDPTDVLLLTARITQDLPGGQKQVVLPFVFTGNGNTSPPLIVPWGPAQLTMVVIAKVHVGASVQACTTPTETAHAIKAAVDAGQPFTLDIIEPHARDQFSQIFTRSAAELEAWLLPQLHTSPPLTSTSFEGVVGADDTVVGIILAVAVLMLAIGAAIFVVLVGLAIIYALNRGYMPINASLQTDVNTGTQYLAVSFGR